VVDKPGLRLGLGDSVNYTGDADLVFTHIYGPLPKQLIGKPAIINVYGNKKAKAEEWCGAELHEVSKWARGLTNTVYVANTALDGPVTLTDLEEDEFAPGRGWFPQALVQRLLAYHPFPKGPITVFDGFMGRGTVGRGARAKVMSFVGIDRDPARVAIAREYLGA
jgi:hypothetical protein